MMPFLNQNRNSKAAEKDKLSLYLFVYALSYALLHILPPYLTYEIKYLLTVGDVFDILTPIIILLLVYRIYLHIEAEIPNGSKRFNQVTIMTALILGGVFFVEGHGMHLSANAISRHLSSNELSPLYSLTYFFDETLGHIFWDGGIIILSIGLVILASANQQTKILSINHALIIPASALYGFTYFVNAVEGQTVIFTLPLAVMIPLFICELEKLKLKFILSNPVLSFFASGYLFAACLFTVWGAWRNGFPQFSDLGWV